MGLAAAGTVAIAVLIALTLLPALLGFAGERWRACKRALLGDGRATGGRRDPMSRRWARFVTRRPVAVLASASRALACVAIPALDLKLGLPDGGSQPTSTTERQAYDLLTEGFGPGFNGPLIVVVDAPASTAADQQQIADGASRGSTRSGVAAVSAADPERDGDLTIVMVTPDARPASDETTASSCRAIRDTADEIRPTPASGARHRHDRAEHRHRRPTHRRAAALPGRSSSGWRCCC